MEYKIGTKVLVATISSALSAVIVAATPLLPVHPVQAIQPALPNIDYNATSAAARLNAVARLNGKAGRLTVPGQTSPKRYSFNNDLNGQTLSFATQSDHFDKALNTTTFSWAHQHSKIPVAAFSVLKRSAAIEQATRRYVTQTSARHGVSAQAFTEAELKYVADYRRGAIISKYQQQANGIDIWGRQFNVIMDQDLQLIATSGYFAAAMAPKQDMASQFQLSASAAISTAFADIGGTGIQLNPSADKADYHHFEASSDNFTFSAQPRGKRVYYPGQKALIPAWYVEIMAAENGSNRLLAYRHIISAIDGSILNRTNMLRNDAFTYKVFADATAPHTPFDSPLGNDLTPHGGVFDDPVDEQQVPMNDITLEHAGISTNDPWLPADATTTTGNNVDAYADLTVPDGFNEGDRRATTSGANTFAYPYDMATPVDSPDNLNAAVVNLFYVNNILHDVYYDHGFDEAAGVAQRDNFGRGGIDGDPLHVEAQDYDGLSNANMFTPADGASPVMQMFLWQEDSIRDGTMDNAIIAHEWGHYISSRLTADGMYANNQGSSMGEGWGDFFALMLMLRQSDQALPGNDRWQGIYNDGGYSVNNGLVEHAHFFGLRRFPYTTDMAHNALTFKHIEDQVPLPASHPISDIHDDGLTPDGILNAQVHNAGELWALVLWESFVALLNRPELDFATAQSRMMDYMVASMKVTPFAPTYTEARDALLAVALANDVIDHQLIWTAFAKRGMGVTAVAPQRFDEGWDGTTTSEGHAGVIESFETHASVLFLSSITLDHHSNRTTGAFCDVDGILDPGETSLMTVTVRNVGTNALSGVKAQLGSSADISFGNNGIIDFAALPSWQDSTSGTVEVTLNSAAINQSIDITVTFIADDGEIILPAPVTTSFNVSYDLIQNRATEDFATPSTVWLTWQHTREEENGDDAEHFLSQWTVFDHDDFGFVAFGPNLSLPNDISLITPTVTVADTGDFAIHFEHYHDFDFDDDFRGEMAFWDGGVIEIRVDGGEWTDVVDAGGHFTVGYNGTIHEYNPILSTRDGFVGTISTNWLEDETLSFPDGVLNGKEVQLRFRIGSGWSRSAWGWNIDNLGFTNATTSTPFSSLVADSGVCVNRAPLVLTATGPQNVTETGIITLSVSAMDHDGSALSYVWSQTAGSTLVEIDSSAATVSFTAPRVSEDEVYIFSVVANDGELSSEPREIPLTIVANNVPEVSAVQSAVEVHESQPFTLTVEGSDADGDALAYQWRQDGIQTGTIGNTLESVAPAVSADTQIIFDVIASDGIDDSEAIQITVNVIANRPPVATTEQSEVDVRAGGTVVLSVSGSDPEGDSLSYRWMLGDIQVHTGSSFTYTAPAVSVDTRVVFDVTAFDGDETSEPLQVTVNIIANRPPVITTAQSEVEVRESETVTLSVSGSDPEGDSLSYRWTLDGSQVNVGSSFVYAAPAVFVDTQRVFAVTAFDGIDTSEAAQITVNIIANRPPEITTARPAITINEGETVTLTVSGSDPEGDGLSYQWRMNGEMLDNSGNRYSFTGPDVTGDTIFTFNITATDGDETSTATQIRITVENSPNGGGNGGGGGGGSSGLWTLLLAPLAFMRRKSAKVGSGLEY